MTETETLRGDVLTKDEMKQRRIKLTEGTRGGVSLEAPPQVPIDIYYNRRKITKAEYRAGNRIFNDFHLSGQSQGITANLTDAQVRGQMGQWRSLSETQQEALDRWKKAIAAVHGKIGQLMILNVCCYGYWLRDINYMPYNEKQSFPRFREALDDLIKHYDAIKNSCGR